MPTKKQMQVEGLEKVKKYINSKSPEKQVDAWDVLMHMENGEFDKFLWKTWRGKIKEAYFIKDNRIFYIVEGGTVFLLYACKKQKNKTSKKDADMIMKRAREL